ncbi:unnamed protein product [Cuscuta campestris]|uniref:Pectinesterase inhibitor domain-containing protein n=1 Tax=Cuscuta campestris TaxID=132261 RepID=A0A484MMC4_9ASTE|nr:unnamed protein product [Cuscuta campestris]
MTPQRVVALPAALLLLLLLCGGANAFLPAFKPGSPVSQFCKTASSKRLCTRMVGGAANLHDATANSIRATLELAEKLRAMSGTVISAATTGLPADSKDSIVKTCDESFEDVVDDLKLSLEALKAKDNGTLMTRLSAALLSDCGDALDDFGVGYPLKTTIKLYARYLDNTLAVVTQQ